MTEDSRISEIRAVLTEYVSTSDPDALWDVRCRIRAIVDREPPAPRVFFPGDTVPAGRLVADDRCVVHELAWEDWRASETYVEIPYTVPNPDEWQAAVERGRDEREVQP